MTDTVLTPPARPRFHQVMAWLFVVIAFAGFIPTYWLKLADGSFAGKPVVHIHGILLFAWVLFYAAQVTFVAQRNIQAHRNWGLMGIALFTAMMISVLLAAINTIVQAEPLGFGTAAKSFSIVTLTAWVLIVGFVGFALMHVHNSDVHRRWMTLAFIPILQAPMARPFAVLMTPPDAPPGPPPVFVTLPPALVVDLLLVAILVRDFRTQGRAHPSTIWGGAAIVLVQIACVPVSTTPQWIAFAGWLASLAG